MKTKIPKDFQCRGATWLRTSDPLHVTPALTLGFQFLILKFVITYDAPLLEPIYQR